MYTRIFGHVITFTIVSAIAGAFLSVVGERGNEQFIFAFMGGCTGAILGAIVGATRTLLLELPDAIERAKFVRKIRALDDDEDKRGEE